MPHQHIHTLYITPQGQRPDQHVPRTSRIILSQIFPQRYATWIAAIEELKDNYSLFSRLTPSPEFIDRLFLVESLRTCLSKLARSSTQFVLLSCWIWNCVLHKAILFSPVKCWITTASITYRHNAALTGQIKMYLSLCSVIMITAQSAGLRWHMWLAGHAQKNLTMLYTRFARYFVQTQKERKRLHVGPPQHLSFSNMSLTDMVKCSDSWKLAQVAGSSIMDDAAAGVKALLNHSLSGQLPNVSPRSNLCCFSPSEVSEPVCKHRRVWQLISTDRLC